MYETGKSADGPRILVVRLGAMGDIIHTLPAVATLKHSFPGSRLTWIVEPKWAPLLEGNPFVDRVALLRRGSLGGYFQSWRELQSETYDFAVDFQGLIKSALTASFAAPDRIYGFHDTLVRERAAALFYLKRTFSSSVHVIERNLDLAAAVGAITAPFGRGSVTRAYRAANKGSGVLPIFPLPPGKPEGDLPAGDFVLASPLAGWRSKQWPTEYYGELAARLRRDLSLPLVLDLPRGAAFPEIKNALTHCSALPGLIYATRRAAAVVGVDSGPMHLAAALGKPGVAIFGPTDPARNGPCGDSMRVLRWASAETTYKRSAEIDESMRRVSSEDVFEALRAALDERRHPAGCLF